MFKDDTYQKRGQPVKTLLNQVVSDRNVSIDEFFKSSLKRGCEIALGFPTPQKKSSSVFDSPTANPSFNRD